MKCCMKNVAGRLPEKSRFRPSMDLKQLKKERQIDHQFFNRPLDFLGLDPVCHFYETHTLHKEKTLREPFQK